MIIAICLLVGTLTLAALAVLSWVLYVPVVVRGFAETHWLRAELHPPLEGSEECQFLTDDGLVLRGSYLQAATERRHGVVAFCHEVTGNRWSAAPYVEQLRQQGFDIFTFDFRNHGASDRLPDYRPLPWLTRYEVADVRAAVDYLCSRPDADPRGVGIFGVSKGASAALCAAADEPRILAVVTDGAFPIDAMQKHYIRRYMNIYIPLAGINSRLPDWCLSSFCHWAKFLVGQRHGCRFLDVEQAARRVRQPVFMIHGERDPYVPVEVAQGLRGALAGRSKLWVVAGAKHNWSISVARREYERRVGRFFRKRLVADRPLAQLAERNAAS